jgi:hypothetical protein
MSSIKTHSLIQRRILAVAAVAVALVTAPVAAQTSPAPIAGAWRADAPLPNGVVQTFRFDPDSTFDLAMELTVEGTYRTDGNQLIETVTLPSVGASHTDTATFAIAGDSLVVTERVGAPPRVLHRVAGPASPSPIVGDWSILIGAAATAHYAFAADGRMHVYARVGDEKGRYVVHADTLRLSNDQSFQLPATARFAISGSVLTLTPPNGKQPRSFHRVLPGASGAPSPAIRPDALPVESGTH